jgi:hypothetical protein
MIALPDFHDGFFDGVLISEKKLCAFLSGQVMGNFQPLFYGT